MIIAEEFSHTLTGVPEDCGTLATYMRGRVLISVIGYMPTGDYSIDINGVTYGPFTTGGQICFARLIVNPGFDLSITLNADATGDVYYVAKVEACFTPD